MKTALLMAALVVGTTAFAGGVKMEPFKDGETVVCLGDSITCGGRYHEFVRDYYATRFPERKIKFVNAGVNGANAASALKRLERDVTPFDPDWVIIDFGVNDVGRDAYTRERTPAQVRHGENCRRNFGENMVKLSDKIVADTPKAKIVYATPTPYDESAVVTNPPKNAKHWIGCNAAVRVLADDVLKLARDRGAPSVDWNRPLNDYTEKRRAAGDMTFMFTAPDRTHPGSVAHAIMAWTLLRAQGVPATVSDVALDAKSGKVAKSENATVTGVKRTADGLTCTVLAKSLPYPVDAEAKPFLAEFDVEETLNREVFAVTGLKPGNYALLIDGTEVATGDAAAFAKGIRLGFNEKTPQYAQAQKFFAATKAAADFDRKLRVYSWNEKIATPEARQKCQEQYDKARAQLKIVPHAYEVKKRD